MTRPQFFLIAGPNGAGKSTLTATIKKRFPDVCVIDPDVVAKNITGSFATINQKQISAGKQTLKMVNNYIQQKQSFLVESTISSNTYLKYQSMAKGNGFRTTFIYVALKNVELCIERVTKRITLGGHSIPLQDIQRRYPRSLNHLKSYIQVFDSAHIYDNSLQYQWVVDYRHGEIHKTSRKEYSWLKPYLP